MSLYSCYKKAQSFIKNQLNLKTNISFLFYKNKVFEYNFYFCEKGVASLIFPKLENSIYLLQLHKTALYGCENFILPKKKNLEYLTFSTAIAIQVVEFLQIRMLT